MKLFVPFILICIQFVGSANICVAANEPVVVKSDDTVLLKDLLGDELQFTIIDTNAAFSVQNDPDLFMVAGKVD